MQKVLDGIIARALAYGKSVGFIIVRFLGFPKSIEELFGKRNGNGAKLQPLLSVRHRAQVCRDDVSRDRLLLLYRFLRQQSNAQPELSEIPMRMQKSDNVEG